MPQLAARTTHPTPAQSPEWTSARSGAGERLHTRSSPRRSTSGSGTRPRGWTRTRPGCDRACASRHCPNRTGRAGADTCVEPARPGTSPAQASGNAVRAPARRRCSLTADCPRRRCPGARSYAQASCDPDQTAPRAGSHARRRPNHPPCGEWAGLPAPGFGHPQDGRHRRKTQSWSAQQTPHKPTCSPNQATTPALARPCCRRGLTCLPQMCILPDQSSGKALRHESFRRWDCWLAPCFTIAFAAQAQGCRYTSASRTVTRRPLERGSASARVTNRTVCRPGFRSVRCHTTMSWVRAGAKTSGANPDGGHPKRRLLDRP